MDSLMNPKSIAVIGASQRMSRGTRVLVNLNETGFQGQVYGINPRYDEVQGYPCFPSVGAVEGGVDCVVAAIPADGVPGALEDAYEAGVRGAVVLSSGFGEGGHANQERVARLRDLAARGMAICGPNCYGVLNLHTGAAPFSGRIADPLVKGGVGLVSQSGGFSNIISDPLMEDRDIGFSFLVSCGNQIGASVEDYLEYLLEDPATNVVAAFVEGFRQVGKLERVGARAHELGKPVIVLKSGRSETGKAAARSHTGSLSGSTEVLTSLLRRHGYIQVYGIDELIETIAMFAVIGERPVSSELIVITGSGGEGSHVADAAEVAGLSLAELPAGTADRIGAALPEFGAAANPVDGTGAMFENPELFPTLLDYVVSGAGTQTVVVNLGARTPRTAYAPMRDFAAAMAAATARTGRALVAYGTSALGTDDRQMLAGLRAAGVPYLAGTQYAMRAIAAAAEFQRGRERAPEAGAERVPRRGDGPGPGSGVLPFLAARDLLASYGVPVVESELATTAAGAAQSAERLGYPVVLKAEAEGLLHKSDAGGVVVGCVDEESVREAFGRITANVTAAGYPALSGVLVQRMSAGATEVFAGVTVDPVLGPAVVFGLGGVFVEIIRDTVTEAAPFGLSVAHQMIGQIRGGQILRGARGRAPADVDALARILVALSELAHDCHDRLVSVDVNPILVGAEGQGAVAVDALVELG